MLWDQNGGNKENVVCFRYNVRFFGKATLAA